MAVKTDADCHQLILEKLSKVRGGQTASAEATARVKKAFDSRIEFLRDELICWWDDDAIPLSAFDPLAEYMTFYCPVITRKERQAYKQDSMEGLRDLRKLSAKASQGAPIVAEYF
ncbi:MAG: hypothetical protein AAGL17_19730 [Cyanobacteria bacterium J06576_12]